MMQNTPPTILIAMCATGKFLPRESPLFDFDVIEFPLNGQMLTLLWDGLNVM
jgi:hypothetical protein